MEDKTDYYKSESISNMLFSYKIKKGRAKEKIITDISVNLQYQDFQHHKLPITTNPLEYGLLIDQIDNKY
jgi:hypothetical protein